MLPICVYQSISACIWRNIDLFDWLLGKRRRKKQLFRMDYNKSTSYVIVLDLFHFMVVILCLLLKSPVGLGFVGADIISEEREEMRYCIENAGSSSSLYRRWLNREPNRRNPKKLTRATSKPANLTGVLLVGWCIL